MIEWYKIESGDYMSSDDRFNIYRAYDRIYGNHWVLRDCNNPDYYKGMWHEDSMKQCKYIAEKIVKGEL